MEIKVVLLDSFTAHAGGGNPAGVAVLDQELTEVQMLAVAKTVGFSETAFVTPSEKADFRVRFFTPAAEVDLCGHATIATFSYLLKIGKVTAGTYTQETGAGVLSVEVRETGEIFMEQSLPEYSSILKGDGIADSLGIRVEELREDLPVQIVSTGLRDILIPVKSLEVLRAIKPDFEKIKHLSKANDAGGYHVFTLETEKGGTAHCRNFAPLYDIPEESATGTSNGALACYLWKHGVERVKAGEMLTFEQGYTMGRPSEIKGLLREGSHGDQKEITRVLIGGKAVPWGEKLVTL